MSFKSRFNQKYKDTPNVFGDKPMPIIENALKYVSSGLALDLGVGNGRNTIYLLSRGFRVTGVDMSKEGIALVKERVPKGSDLNLIVSDVLDFETTEKFDFVCAIGLFHFLNIESINKIIKNMKDFTKSAGLNVIAARMTQNYMGDLPHIFVHDELKSYYSTDEDWEILEYKEQGNMHRKVTMLIAQKK
ncbi:methyltransferase domain-containing protein [Patescibacteria group bacterium]|nr:methyltransferase domain-containing protein [Patescibacteria group bacterium]